MRFGHIRSHDENAVAVLQVFLKSCSGAASERGAQTGHRSAVSYAGLIFNRDHAQAAAEEFLNQVILFIIHRRAAQTCHRRQVIENCAVTLFDKICVASFFNAISDPTHRPIERTFFPMIGIGRAI